MKIISKRGMKIGPNGTMDYEAHGAVLVKRYHGRFTSDALNALANTGLWYAKIMGNPFAATGEGTTPLAAIKDAIARTQDLIEKMQQGTNALRTVAEQEWPSD